MRKTIVVCDFEHDPDDDAVASKCASYQVADTTYYIDLCPEHDLQYEAFLELQKRWVNASRTEEDPDASKPKSKRQQPSINPADAAAARAWAVANHLDVSHRGRIPLPVIRQWEAAGSPKLAAVTDQQEEPSAAPLPPALTVAGALPPPINRSFMQRRS